MVRFQKLHKDAQLPEYAHGPENDVGMDLKSVEACAISPGEVKLIKTGWAIELPPNHEGQVRSRSGLALKNSIAVLNSPGTIDPSYRGEIGVILINHGKKDFKVAVGDKIAQLVIAKYEYPDRVEIVEQLTDSARGDGGFGSTDKK